MEKKLMPYCAIEEVIAGRKGSKLTRKEVDTIARHVYLLGKELSFIKE